MKVINDDRITWPVVVDSANGEYPITNVSTDIRTQLWKAAFADTTPKMVVDVTTGADSLGIANTNATSIQVVVKDNLEAIVSTTSYTMGDYSDDIFVSYTQQNTAHTLEITFTCAAGVVPECGIIRAGLAVEVTNPTYGLQEGLRDNSIIRELNSGVQYYKKRNILRFFSGSFLVERDTSFYDFMYSVAKEHGQNPLMWEVTDINALEWAIFGYLSGMPSGQHSYYTHSQISFALNESV